MEIQSRLAKRTAGLTPSPIRKLVPLMRLPGMISLGGGYPNPKTFAFSTMEIGFRSGLKVTFGEQELDIACQYGPTDSIAELKPHLIAWHAHKDSVNLQADQIQVLNGSQEGLHIMAYLFLDSEDSVVVSEPAYPGALGAFQAFTRRFLSIPLDESGTRTDVMEKRLEELRSQGGLMPKFIYEVPNGHNPAGVAMSIERRRHLLEIASKYDLLILEDDPYQLLQLESDKRLPTLQKLDRDNRVIRLDSFSKIFAPGLRIGYASGHPDIIRLFQLYKQGSNLHTSSMVQRILAGFFDRQGYEGFMNLIRENCKLYRSNRDAMVSAARCHLPRDIRFNIPGEGMFIWFEMPENFDAHRMVDTDGMELKVLMVPGGAFSAMGGLKNCMRASYSMVSAEQIDMAMQRFSIMIQRESMRLR